MSPPLGFTMPRDAFRPRWYEYTFGSALIAAIAVVCCFALARSDCAPYTVRIAPIVKAR